MAVVVCRSVNVIYVQSGASFDGMQDEVINSYNRCKRVCVCVRERSHTLYALNLFAIEAFS